MIPLVLSSNGERCILMNGHGMEWDLVIKTCFNCQYYREADFIPQVDVYTNWCSNSKSYKSMGVVMANDTCPVFLKKGRKANIGVQIAKVLLRKVK